MLQVLHDRMEPMSLEQRDAFYKTCLKDEKLLSFNGIPAEAAVPFVKMAEEFSQPLGRDLKRCSTWQVGGTRAASQVDGEEDVRPVHQGGVDAVQCDRMDMFRVSSDVERCLTWLIDSCRSRHRLMRCRATAKRFSIAILEVERSQHGRFLNSERNLL